MLTAKGPHLRAVLVAAALGLAVGMPAAYAALGAQDTQTGTGALASETSGDGNTADGYEALTAQTRPATSTRRSV
jgi:hypothetical protein